MKHHTTKQHSQPKTNFTHGKHTGKNEIYFPSTQNGPKHERDKVGGGGRLVVADAAGELDAVGSAALLQL